MRILGKPKKMQKSRSACICIKDMEVGIKAKVWQIFFLHEKVSGGRFHVY